MAGRKFILYFLLGAYYDGIYLHITSGGGPGSGFQNVIKDGGRNGITLIFSYGPVVKNGVCHEA
jgi:hypothetical protein